MEKNDIRDLTTGHVGRKLLRFSLPIMAVNLLQALYNIVDMIIVGQFISPAGMSAVGTGGQVTHLILVVIMGFSNGGAVVIGQLFGMKKMDEAKKVLGSFVSFSILLSLAFTAAVLIFLNPIVRALNAPPESYDYTVGYLAVCASGTLFIYVYNAFNCALRGIGESTRPMIFVLITTIENLLLDLLFIAVFDLGVTGAALATVISQFSCMLLIVSYVCRKTGLFALALSSFKIYGKKLFSTIKVGLPQACQFILTSISFLFIVALINTYGAEASAAANATNKISSFGVLPGQAMMAGLITMTAQNLPKGDYARIMRGWRYGEAVAFCVTALIVLACQLWPAGIFAIFTPDASVAEIGATYLRVYSLCFIFENFMFCIFGVLTGSGYTTVTFICAVVSAFGVRYALAVLLSSYTVLGFNGIAAAYTGAPIVGIIIGGLFLASGRWKKSRINIQ